MKNLILILMLSLTSFASPSLDVDTSESDKFSTDSSTQQKKSIDKKKSKGKKDSTTTSIGNDTMTQSQWKVDQQASRSNSIDISVDIGSLFIDQISKLEKRGVEPFGYCKLYTQPKVADFFGFTAMTKQRNGFAQIDTVRASMLEQAAKSNATVNSASHNAENKLKIYRDCMAYYGAIIGQSIITLNKELPAVSKVNKNKKNNQRLIYDIGLEDLKLLAKGALNKTLAKGVKSKFIKSYYQQIIKDEKVCRFNGSTTSINCGAVTMGISSKPTLEVGGVQYFGSFETTDHFAGLAGSYKISANFSYSNAIDELQSVSKYKKFAKDIQEYTDSLISKGYAKEAISIKKKAYDWAISNKTAIKIDKSFITSFK